MSEPETTPLPWEWWRLEGSSVGYELGHDPTTDGFSVHPLNVLKTGDAGFWNPTEADRNLIVRRVNAGPAVDALVARLEELHASTTIGECVTCSHDCQAGDHSVAHPCETARAVAAYKKAAEEA